jgi:hypothetical protein
VSALYGQGAEALLSGTLGKSSHVEDYNRPLLDSHDPRLLPYVQVFVDAFARPPDKFPEFTL